MSARVSPPDTSLRGRWLLLARVVWVAVAVLYVDGLISGNWRGLLELDTIYTIVVYTTFV